MCKHELAQHQTQRNACLKTALEVPTLHAFQLSSELHNLALHAVCLGGQLFKHKHDLGLEALRLKHDLQHNACSS
jgi:hypothetical protein